MKKWRDPALFPADSPLSPIYGFGYLKLESRLISRLLQHSTINHLGCSGNTQEGALNTNRLYWESLPSGSELGAQF